MLLLSLLLGAALAAALVLFLQFRLENIRQRVQQAIAERMGADLIAERVQVVGLRGIRIRDFNSGFALPNGPLVRVHAPEALIYVDLGNLLSGRVTVDRFQVDNATIHLESRQDGAWSPPGLGDLAGATGLGQLLAFRVVGTRCTVTLRDVLQPGDLHLEEVDFDIMKAEEAEDLVGRLAGHLGRSGDGRATEGAAFSGNIRYAGMEDFDLRAQFQALRAETLVTLFPAADTWIKAGIVGAALRFTGYANDSVVVSLDGQFEGLTLENLPEFLGPATGSVIGLGIIDRQDKMLTLANMAVESEQARGRIEGTMDFSGETPVLDLRAATDMLPVDALLQHFLAGQPQAVQAVQADIDSPYEVRIALGGTLSAPEAGIEARAQEGRLSYAPGGAFPRVDLQFRQLRLLWDSVTGEQEAVLEVVDGEVLHAATGIRATNLKGALNLSPRGVLAETISAEVMGWPVAGRLEYLPALRQCLINASGMFEVPVDNPLSSRWPVLQISGPVQVRCTADLKPDRYLADLSADATRADIAYNWWLRKPVGVGANLEAINVDIRPAKSIQISGLAAIDTARVNAVAGLSRRGGKWGLDSLRTRADAIDVATLNKCLRLPYTATGGQATNATLEWTRAAAGEGHFDVAITGMIDELSLLPASAEAPFHFQDTQVALSFSDRGEDRGGALTLDAREAETPPLGATWFVPLRPADPELARRFPQHPRDWTMALSAGDLAMPPWRGTAFRGQAFSNRTETGLSSFGAQVEEGTITGSYRFEREERISHLNADWQQVPAHYLLEHLKFPPALSGESSGEIRYVIDLDDPSTLRGNGAFSISEGQFSADFLVSMLENRLQSTIGSLPPSLRFNALQAEVELIGDRVTTRDLRFESPGLVITGSGGFVLQGDMDYTVNVAVAPEIAQRIPALRDNFSIEGHRVTQSTIDLAFRVTGPAFAPKGSVAGLPPLGVTLVSSAVGVTSEAIRIIDVPRQILLDLLRLGGGIVGAGQ